MANDFGKTENTKMGGIGSTLLVSSSTYVGKIRWSRNYGVCNFDFVNVYSFWHGIFWNVKIGKQATHLKLKKITMKAIKMRVSRNTKPGETSRHHTEEFVFVEPLRETITQLKETWSMDQPAKNKHKTINTHHCEQGRADNISYFLRHEASSHKNL